MVDVLPHHLEEGKRALEVRLAATRHDSEARRLGTDLSAGDGGIHPVHPLSKGLGLRHARGAEVDDQGLGMKPLDEPAFAKDHLLHDIRHREVDADDSIADLAGEFGQARGSYLAHCHRRLGWCRATIPHHHLGSGIMQMPRIGPAHVAQADESDLVSEKRFAHVYARIAQQSCALCKSGFRQTFAFILLRA